MGAANLERHDEKVFAYHSYGQEHSLVLCRRGESNMVSFDGNMLHGTWNERWNGDLEITFSCKVSSGRRWPKYFERIGATTWLYRDARRPVWDVQLQLVI